MVALLLQQSVNGLVSNLGLGVHATQATSIYTLTVAGSQAIPDGLELVR